jgi:hypothetical protein
VQANLRIPRRGEIGWKGEVMLILLKIYIFSNI